MTEPDWTPEEAYRVLRVSLDHFLAGDVSPTQLHSWLVGGFAVPHGTPSTHPANNLWRLAVTDTAIFTQCDFDRDELAASIRNSIAAVEVEGKTILFTLLMKTRCFFDMVKTQSAPAPLINQTAQNVRAAWEAEGFREI